MMSNTKVKNKTILSCYLYKIKQISFLVDETRVKLMIDEDDEIGSDYINASYIRVRKTFGNCSSLLVDNFIRCYSTPNMIYN